MHQLIYITCASDDEARNIARSLLEKRLIGCANILPPMTSYFQWDGDIQHNNEVILIAKSVKDHFLAIEADVLALHSYKCPCILAFDVANGHSSFLEWIHGETAKKPA